MPNAGSKVLADDFSAIAYDQQGVGFDTTITSFGTASSGGTYNDCGTSFIAPTSGTVVIHTSARMTNTGANGTLISPEVRTGGAIGSGTVVEAAGDNHGPANYTGTYLRLGVAHIVAGLTAGSTYNVRLLHRVVSGTGSFAYREVIVAPAP